MRFPMIAVLVFATLVPPHPAAAGPSPARALIERSIAYHDPGGVWWTSVRTIELRQPRAEGAERRTTFTLRPDALYFEMAFSEGAVTAAGWLLDDTCAVDPVRDTEPPVGGVILDCERLRQYRSYYSYLFNLPMNLLDDAATVELQPIETTFMERPVRAVRITYGEGEPQWEHYFDPETAALVGCRFARDPEWKTGEYIVYEGETASGGVRLPRERAWYFNDGGKWLGTDVIESLRIEPASAQGDE